MKTIFVSSTFRDMHYERDIIHERVTPALNHVARQYGESVSFCDLRWGVNTGDLESEEGSRKVLSVCMEEIDRCRPYMLVILGYRYGWIPSTGLIANAADRTGLMIDDLEQSVTALEIEYGALSNPEQMEHTLFYFREFEDEIPEIYRSEDDYHAEKLHALKERIRKLAGGRLKTYTLGWDGRENRPCGLEAFAEMVESDLKALMEAEWQQTAALTPFQRDQLSQWDYAAGKVRQFSARESFITTYINKLDYDTNLLALRGESGTGKSTLMARMAYALKERGDKALPIFCSTTPLSNDGTDLIRYLVDFLETELKEPHFADMEQEEKTGTKEWTDRLAELAEIYSSRGEKRLVILIDAVDQLFADEVRDQLRFIPYSLTNRVQMVLSCLSDYHLSRSMDCVMVEPLAEGNRPEIIRGILRAQGRELDGQVISAIIQKPAAKSPLYLSLLIQRLIMMNKDDFEDISVHGDGMDAITRHQTELVKRCSDTLEGVCVDIIEAASGRLGGAFVRKAVQYLAVSRHGLRENDLEALLSVGNVRWSALDFARFVQYLSAFFILRDDGRYDFAHQSIRRGLEGQCEDVQTLHQEILEHLSILDPHDSVRMREFGYHCILADDKKTFVDYVQEFKSDQEIMSFLAKDAHDLMLTDHGTWLQELLRNGMELQAGHQLVNFVNHELWALFGESQSEMELECRMLKAGLAFAQQLNARNKTPESRRDLSVSYDNVGDVYKELGGSRNLERTFAMYPKSLELREDLCREQGTAESRRDLSISYERIGAIYEELGGSGNLEKALVMHQKSLALREELCRKQGTSESRRDLSASYSNIGDIYKELGGSENLEKALIMYQKSLELREDLCREQGTSESRRALSVSYRRIGDIYKELGESVNLERALAMYQKSLELFEELCREQGKTASRRDLSLSYERIGNIYEEMGGSVNLEKALAMHQKSLELREELYREQGTSASRRDLSVSYERIGVIYKKLGGSRNLERALAMYQKSMKLSEELCREQGTAVSRRDLSVCYERIGDIYEGLGGSGNLEKALEMYRKSMKLSEELSRELKTLSAYDDLAVSYYRVGTHPATKFIKRRKYLKQFLKLSEMLFQQTQNERYEKFVSVAKRCLNKI